MSNTRLPVSIRLAAVLGACVVVASGCSSAQGEPPPEPASAASAEQQQTSVLTGLPVDSQPQRPVYVVKVDDTAAGRPQRGITAADLVIVEPVEGGLTRLVAFYQSKLPGSVGPTRSARISDIGLVEPVSATVVSSGAAPITLRAFERAGVPLIDETHDAVKKDPNRPFPYHRFVDLAGLSMVGEPPKHHYFTFGTSELAGGKAVKKVTVTFSPDSAEKWTWGSGTWRRADPGAGQFPATSLLLLDVGMHNAGYRDSAGSSVPVVESTGTGSGQLLTDGKAHKLTWSKASKTAPFELKTLDGRALQVPPGRTWVGLLPKRTGNVEMS